MALNPESGSSTADTYANLADFKAYLAIRLPIPEWSLTATDTELENALKMSAILLDRSFNWNGVASLPNQSRSFPRTGLLNRNGGLLGALEIPTELKYSQMELGAQAGGSDLLSENEAEKLGVSLVKAGSVQVEFQSRSKPDNYDSLDVQTRMQSGDYGYLNIPLRVRTMLISSWYKTVTVKATPRFRML